MIKNHGLMFHHFYDKTYIKGQGAISADDLENIITYYKTFYNVLSAEEYFLKAIQSKLKDNDVCVTFDDALKCQFDVALPVLESHNLTAFWFVYTSPFLGHSDKLEVYRQFRTDSFSNIDDFYDIFFNIVKNEYQELDKKLKDFDPKSYLAEYSFYTDNDRKFRFLRDGLLGKMYNVIMDKMIDDFDYKIDDAMAKLILDKNQILQLHNNGHIIGLHSHSHPTLLGTQSYEQQEKEYSTNKEILEDMIQSQIKSVSYPCNSYNKDTINLMKKLGIELGFRANMEDGQTSILELSREDHANIMKKLKSI